SVARRSARPSRPGCSRTTSPRRCSPRSTGRFRDPKAPSVEVTARTTDDTKRLPPVATVSRGAPTPDVEDEQRDTAQNGTDGRGGHRDRGDAELDHGGAELVVRLERDH